MTPIADGSELRLGTRGSALALTQSRWVADRIRARGTPTEMVVVRTTGDRMQDRPLPEIGGKGLFTKELDRALLDHDIDLAVHSLKDLPTESEAGLVVAAIPVREDPRDVLITRTGASGGLASLPENARVGTSSLRRQALALAFRPDLEVVPIRGNLDTRIRKVDDGEYDAIVVAGAGVKRLGWSERIAEWLELTAWLPAPGQGALGIVTRADDEEVRRLLMELEHGDSRIAVAAERSLLGTLEGGCRVPVAALGLPYAHGLRLWGLVASPDGRRAVRADRTGDSAEPEELGRRVPEVLLERGAGEILDEVRAGPDPPIAAP